MLGKGETSTGETPPASPTGWRALRLLRRVFQSVVARQSDEIGGLLLVAQSDVAVTLGELEIDGQDGLEVFRARRGPEQQGESDVQKVLRLPGTQDAVCVTRD